MVYPTLLSPLVVAGNRLPNRVLMGSMHTGLEDLEDGHLRMAAFYGERARGGVALIVTGGLAPNVEGNTWAHFRTFGSDADAERHRTVTDAVHQAGGRIALQLLHAGRYAHHKQGVAPSPLQSPISPSLPREMSEEDIERTINDYVQAAVRAQSVGYDGIEIMGSEGYLIHQFIAQRTNQRNDQWGGSLGNRFRFAVEIVRRTRAATAPNFILIFRLSLLDLVEGGSTWDEIVALAKAIEEAGASIINTGIGWHEARIPTIASVVPRAAFTPITGRLKSVVSIPLITSNRINDPQVAEAVLVRGDADMVSMARPLLADAHFVRKAAAGKADEINTCIACNQACLDHIFAGKICSCLVNPVACHETEMIAKPAMPTRRVAVVGAGPAGLSCAVTAAARGHAVTLFEADSKIGGQFNYARMIPGKDEFAQTLRYYQRQLERLGVDVRLGQRVTAEALSADGFDHVVVATGVAPRVLTLPGIDHPMVIPYPALIDGSRQAGQRVAVIGAGGIGFDVAELLTHTASGDAKEEAAFFAEWGIDVSSTARGGLGVPQPAGTTREVWLLQRKRGRLGNGLAKTTGWIRQAILKRRGVHMLDEVTYEKIDDAGLHLTVHGEPMVLPVDSVIVCAGQESVRDLAAALAAAKVPNTLIGGASVASEVDAKRAIDEGTRLALAL